jgi:DNA repair protein SbcD/Mre11
MSLTPFRFLQAGDFALDQPLGGFAEPPSPLGDLLVNAPYLAAQKVFDAALDERIDFLVLTGDLVDLTQPSPRAITFLLENLERLDSKGVATYWAGGKLDPPQDWPSAARLPGGVQVFPVVDPEELSHFRGDRPVATLVGRSWHGTTAPGISQQKLAPGGLPTIVVGYGQPPEGGATEAGGTAPLPYPATTYWALGGSTRRQSHAGLERVIHYAGSPQGRSPGEVGPHGCTLVQIAADRQIRTKTIATDVVRWHTERLTIEADATLDGVKQLLTERVHKLRGEADERPLIVTWKLHGGSHLAGPAARRDLAAEWQAWLCTEFVRQQPIVWTHTVQLDQPELPAAWLDEESMLGDFLRNLHELAALEPAEVDFCQHVPEQHRAAELAALAEWTEEEHRTVLHEAALSGAQLLGAADRV